MSKIKRLNAPSFLSHPGNLGRTMDEVFGVGAYMQVEPIFERDGWYYDRISRRCWYECAGSAWESDGAAEQFLFVLHQLNTPSLPKAVLFAIATLRAYRTCPGDLRSLERDHKVNVDFHEVERSSRMIIKRIKERAVAYKAQLANRHKRPEPKLAAEPEIADATNGSRELEECLACA